MYVDLATKDRSLTVAALTRALVDEFTIQVIENTTALSDDDTGNVVRLDITTVATLTRDEGGQVGN